MTSLIPYRLLNGCRKLSTRPIKRKHTHMHTTIKNYKCLYMRMMMISSDKSKGVPSDWLAEWLLFEWLTAQLTDCLNAKIDEWMQCNFGFQCKDTFVFVYWVFSYLYACGCHNSLYLFSKVYRWLHLLRSLCRCVRVRVWVCLPVCIWIYLLYLYYNT